MIEGDRSRSYAAFQHRMQIAAMNVHVRAAVAPLGLGVEHELCQGLAGVPGTAHIAPRFDAGGDEALFQAKSAQHLADVGRKNDSSADARERRCLLVDLHRKACALQKSGCGQAAKSGPDDSNSLLSLHQCAVWPGSSTRRNPSRSITGSSVTRSTSASSVASWKCGRHAGAAITSPRRHSKRSPSTVVAPLPLTMA